MSPSGAAIRKSAHRVLAHRFAPLLVFVVCGAVYVPTAHARSGDVVTADVAAWQLAKDGGRTFDPAVLPPLAAHPLRATWVIERSDGTLQIGRYAGVIVASVPAYLLARADRFTETPARYTAGLMSAASVAILFAWARRRVSPRTAALGAACFGFTTPVWSVAADGMWPHTITVFAIIAMAWAADRERWFLVGLCGGVALWGRLHAALICAVLCLGVAVSRRDPKIAAKAGITGVVALAAVAAWTKWYYGSWNPTAAYNNADTFGQWAGDHGLDILNLTGFFVAPDRGILVWTPLIVLMLPALRRSWAGLPDWSRWLLVGGLAYTLLQGTLSRYSGGDSFFPYRLMLEPLACATPALILSARNMGPAARRVFFHTVVVQAAPLVLLGALDLGTSGDIPSDRPELLIQSTTAASLCLGWWLVRWWARRAVAKESGPADQPA